MNDYIQISLKSTINIICKPLIDIVMASTIRIYCSFYQLFHLLH